MHTPTESTLYGKYHFPVFLCLIYVLIYASLSREYVVAQKKAYYDSGPYDKSGPEPEPIPSYCFAEKCTKGVYTFDTYCICYDHLKYFLCFN